jgi:hypothetical protein
MADLGRSPAEQAPLAPYLFWGVLAACAVVLAVGSIIFALSSTERREPQRIAIRAPQPGPLPAPTLAAVEIGRLSDNLRTLAAEREKLTARVEHIERSLGDITASISRQKPAETPAATADPTVDEPVAPPLSGSIATRTEFAVDLGGEASIDGLRTLWASMRGTHAPLQALRPLVSVRDGTQPGTVELRLVAGPFANAAAAARVCAALAAKRVACATTVFDGQRLGLR